MKYIFSTLTFLFAFFPLVGWGATCETEDFQQYVSGAKQCLRMRISGDLEPVSMVVWLHGDITNGKFADYHFPVAQQLPQEPFGKKVLSIALVRPGYTDGTGQASTVDPLHQGRIDSYTAENVNEIGVAIERLKTRYKPANIVVVGHSGGAAIAALLLGKKPDLINAALLLACPCDVVTWRASKMFSRVWPRSENPARWIDEVNPATRVIALTGAKDDNTEPELAQKYVDALTQRHVKATFVAIPGKGHNEVFFAPEVLSSLESLLQPK